MQGRHAAGFASELGVVNNRDSRTVQKVRRVPHHVRAEHRLQQCRVVSREQRCALDGEALRQQEHVPRASKPGAHQLGWRRFTEHHADENRTRQPGNDFGMSADKLDIALCTGGTEIGEIVQHVRRRRPFGKQAGDEKPSRRCAQAGDVVRVDFDEVKRRAVTGKGDGVVLGDEDHVPHGDGGRISPNARTNKDARVIRADG